MMYAFKRESENRYGSPTNHSWPSDTLTDEVVMTAEQLADAMVLGPGLFHLKENRGAKVVRVELTQPLPKYREIA